MTLLSRSRRSMAPITLAVGLLLLAGALSGLFNVAAAHAAPATPGAATPSTTTTPATKSDGAGGKHGGGRGGCSQSSCVGGAIASVSGSTLTVTTRNSTTKKVTLTATTTVTRLGKTVDTSTLAVGQNIRAEGTTATDGTLTATKITIEVPHVGGKVTAVSGSSITITGRTKTYTVVTSGTTTFLRAGQTASLSDVSVGTQIEAYGMLSDTTLTAEQVVIALPHAGGKVTAISGSTYTLTAGRGGTQTQTFSTTSATTVVVDGTNGSSTAGALSDVKVGSFVSVEGTKNSDGSITALRIHIHTPRS